MIAHNANSMYHFFISGGILGFDQIVQFVSFLKSLRLDSLEYFVRFLDL